VLHCLLLLTEWRLLMVISFARCVLSLGNFKKFFICGFCGNSAGNLIVLRSFNYSTMVRFFKVK